MFSKSSPRVCLPEAAEQDLAALRPDRAARHVERARTDRRGDLVEGESVLAQPHLVDLDRDLVGARGAELDLGDAVDRAELVTDALAELLEHVLLGLACDDDGEHLLVEGELLHDRLFGVLRERVDRIDLVLDVAE